MLCAGDKSTQDRDIVQAQEYLLRLSIDNLIKAGYSSYTINPIDSIEQASLQLDKKKCKSKNLNYHGADKHICSWYGFQSSFNTNRPAFQVSNTGIGVQ